jgi:hypothetical protein
MPSNAIDNPESQHIRDPFAVPKSSAYWPLFEHLVRDHNLTLLDSELEDICHLVLMMRQTTVFEAVDSTNEEIYWTLGVWPTRQEALAALEVENPEDVGCQEADEFDEHRTIELRERKIGWCGAGKLVARVEWEATWDEAAQEYVWTRQSFSP